MGASIPEPVASFIDKVNEHDEQGFLDARTGRTPGRGPVSVDEIPGWRVLIDSIVFDQRGGVQ